MVMGRAFFFASGVSLCVALAATTASAQGAPPAAAPPAAAPTAAPPPAAAAPAYGPQAEPPPGYAPPGYVPAWRAQPMEMRYIEGRPIPPGYHVETRLRRGLIVSGPII